MVPGTQREEASCLKLSPGGTTVGTQVRFRPDCGREGVVLVKSVSRGGP